MRDIGKNIRQLRIAQNMTQEEFAERLYVTRQTVSNYEKPFTDISVRYFCKITFLPFVMTLFGWLILQAFGDFLSLRPWSGKGSKLVRYVAACLFGLILQANTIPMNP